LWPALHIFICFGVRLFSGNQGVVKHCGWPIALLQTVCSQAIEKFPAITPEKVYCCAVAE
jgi:hypothetical protein